MSDISLQAKYEAVCAELEEAHKNEKIILATLDMSADMLRVAESARPKWTLCSDELPASEGDHIWSERVIAKCDLGNIYHISYMAGMNNFGGCWQRPESFVNSGSKEIVSWMYEPPEAE